MRRPFGIAIISVADFLFGVVYAFGGFSLLASPDRRLMAVAYVFLALGLLSIVGGYGLWSFQEWGRMLNVFGSGIGVIISILSLMGFDWNFVLSVLESANVISSFERQIYIQEPNPALDFIVLAISIVIIIYLSTPKVGRLYASP